MRDFYEFDEDRYQRKSNIRAYIAIALVFALLGGAIAYAITSSIISTDNDNVGKVDPNDKQIGVLDEKDSIELGFAEDLLIDINNPIVDIAEKDRKSVV